MCQKPLQISFPRCCIFPTVLLGLQIKPLFNTYDWRKLEMVDRFCQVHIDELGWTPIYNYSGTKLRSFFLLKVYYTSSGIRGAKFISVYNFSVH